MTKMEKAGFAACILLIIILSFLVIISKNGMVDYYRLRQREALLVKQFRDIEARNILLEKEINSLKTDMEYIKHLAKHNHDMAEENELIFKDEKLKQDSEP